ncbi:MAG: YfhO family protein [Chloroflexota bacterium]
MTNYQLPITTQSAQSQTSNLFYTDYRPGHFTVVAQTPEPAFLVLAEVWYPGWRATIDDDLVIIYRANTAFMAVQIPSGESAVTFNFTSPMLIIGAIISALTILLSAILFTRQTTNVKRRLL